MKQSRYFSRWKPRYFRLEDGFLTYYDKKSLVGTNHKNKVGAPMAKLGSVHGTIIALLIGMLVMFFLALPTSSCLFVHRPSCSYIHSCIIVQNVSSALRTNHFVFVLAPRRLYRECCAGYRDLVCIWITDVWYNTAVHAVVLA